MEWVIFELGEGRVFDGKRDSGASQMGCFLFRKFSAFEKSSLRVLVYKKLMRRQLDILAFHLQLFTPWYFEL